MPTIALADSGDILKSTKILVGPTKMLFHVKQNWFERSTVRTRNRSNGVPFEWVTGLNGDGIRMPQDPWAEIKKGGSVAAFLHGNFSQRPI
jgi:hypothetical protein